jgi:ketosteroid isomerase-like protein
MSEQSVAVVRRILEAFEAGDPEPALALYADDVEWTPAADEPETATLYGKEAMQGLFLQWITSFDDFHWQTLEYIDAGDLVLVVLKFSGRMRGSGAEVGFDETWVHRVRDGLVCEVHEYRTKDEAVRAAGLEAPPG